MANKTFIIQKRVILFSILLMSLLLGCSRHPVTSFETLTPTESHEMIFPYEPTKAAMDIDEMDLLLPRDRERFLEWISMGNGGCVLPCIWGIDPYAVNAVDDFNRLVKRFGDINEYPDTSIGSAIADEGAVLSWLEEKDESDIDINFVRKEDNCVRYLLLNIKNFSPTTWKEENTKDEGYPIPEYHYYFLDNIVKEYGTPSQIYVAPDPEEWERRGENTPVPNISVVLYYEKEGFLIGYLMPKELTSARISGCLNKIFEIMIISWNKKGGAIQDTNIWGLWPQITESRFEKFYKPIEVIMPKDKFVELMINGTGQKCLEIPMPLWGYK